MYVVAYVLWDCRDFIDTLTGKNDSDVVFILADILRDEEIEDMTLQEAFDYIESGVESGEIEQIGITVVDPNGEEIFKV